jgi:hypothetical protein
VQRNWQLPATSDEEAAALQQTGARTMTVLRFYWIDSNGHIRRPAEEVECENDDDARAKLAEKLMGGPLSWSVEVWDGARLIAKGMSIPGASDTQAAKLLHGSNQPAMGPRLRGLRPRGRGGFGSDLAGSCAV